MWMEFSHDFKKYNVICRTYISQEENFPLYYKGETASDFSDLYICLHFLQNNYSKAANKIAVLFHHRSAASPVHLNLPDFIS